MLGKAEKVLDECLEMDTVVPIVVDGEVIDKKVDAGLAKIKQDTAKFIASRLGKDNDWSERTELTGKDGKDLPTPILSALDKEPKEQSE